MKKFWIGFLTGILCTLLIVCSGILGYRRGLFGKDSILSDAAYRGKFRAIENMIAQYYLKEPDKESMEEGIYKGLVYGLDDPYSVYYTAEEYEKNNLTSQGYYEGIGAVFTLSEEGGALVTECYEGAPAKEAGLLPGDLITAVNHVDITEKSLAEIVALVQEESADEVVFTCVRDGSEPFDLTVPVEEVEIESVTGEMLEDSVGYICIKEFTSVSLEQFRKVYADLQEEKMQGMIVDLRDNPGGYLDVVCDILREILPEGIIVYSEDKNGTREEEYCEGDKAVSVPVAVLVNGNSASSSEIFAGAVQDYGIGSIVGSTTYGKGLVQSIRTLSDGSAVRLTTSHYYTPKGNDIDGVGIVPDIPVEETTRYVSGSTLPEEDAVLCEALRAVKRQEL